MTSQFMTPNEHIGYGITASDYQSHLKRENRRTGLINEALASVNQELLYIKNSNYAHYFTYKQLDDSDTATKIFDQKAQQLLESKRQDFLACYESIYQSWQEKLRAFSHITTFSPFDGIKSPVVGLCGKVAEIPALAIACLRHEDVTVLLQCPGDQLSKQRNMSAGGSSIFQYEYLVCDDFCAPANYVGFTEESIKKHRFAQANHLRHTCSLVCSVGFSPSSNGIMTCASVERLFQLLDGMEFSADLTTAYLLRRLTSEVACLGGAVDAEVCRHASARTCHVRRRYLEQFEQYDQELENTIHQLAGDWLFDQFNH